MADVYIIGAGMIRFGNYPEYTVDAMAKAAARLAIKEAALTPGDLQAVFFSNTFWGLFSNQHAIRGQVALRDMDLEAIPIINVENACAGGATALHMAHMAIRSGMHDVVLALGAEKNSDAGARAVKDARRSLTDVNNIEGQLRRMEAYHRELMTDAALPDCARTKNNVLITTHALGPKWHMSRFGSTVKQLAAISAKNYAHGAINPMARYHRKISQEEIMAEPSLFYPLTPSMCAKTGDGAAAVILCSPAYLNNHRTGRKVKIIASVLGSGMDRDLDDESLGERLAKTAYEMAGVGPLDIDLAELHDATAYEELHQTEVLGFCPLGEGGLYAESGATRLGGDKPVNPSGGLESRSHPTGATGLAQVIEIYNQLRHTSGNRQVEGARIGLSLNQGGSMGLEEAAMGIHILEGF